MPTCLISIPAGPAFEDCARVLTRGITSAGLQPVRAGDLDRPHAFEQIWDQLESAAACVIDLTNRTHVPMYVFGLAQGRGKIVIPIAVNDAHLPFDVRLIHHIIYRPGGPRWEDMLAMQVQSALRGVGSGARLM